MTTASRPARRLRIGVDVGGTFTDFVMADHAAGTLHFHKEPSVPADPSLAVARGIAALLADLKAGADEIELVAHGTTLALNAIIQRRGAPVALVVSRGNRDVMELARGRLPNSYNFRIGRERPLVPRENVYEVAARVLADGTIASDIDEGELDNIANDVTARGIGAVAVMLINSYRHPALEARVAEGLARRLQGALVTASAALWPELKEYERALIAALNATIHPLMADYLDRLTERLAILGVTAPITITANNGGTMSVATARARPIDSILSGPASGVRAAALVGGKGALLTFDMGGTSTDVASVENGELEFARTSMVGDYPLMLPVVNVSAIGAGGGSLAWLDRQNVLRVGPDSAGADPGPVAYSLGGTQPTITDALLTLGVLHPERFLAGRMRLDAPAAVRALAALAPALGRKDAVEVANAVIEVATARMATELTKFLAQKGADPRDSVLVAYGGAGPTMANILAAEAHVGQVLVPPSPGTFCALGALLADIRRDFVRAARVAIGPGSEGWATIMSLLADAETEARAWIEGEGDLVRGTDVTITGDMRYPGQAYELVVPIFAGKEGETVAAFHAAHERAYGFCETDNPVEVMNLRLAVTGRLAPVVLPDVAAGPPPAPFESRAVHLGTSTTVPVYRRADIAAGAVLDGPLVVEQADTTTYVLAGWRLTGEASGCLRLTRRST